MSEFAGKGTLLIVDDEPDIREILATFLADHCERVLTAKNGEAALELVKTEKIDVILSDINMPVMNGLEFLRACNDLGVAIPFIFVTAFGERTNLLEALRLGATDFVEKPFDHRDVIGIVRKSMHHSLALQSSDQEIDDILKSARISPEARARLLNLRKSIVRKGNSGE